MRWLRQALNVESTCAGAAKSSFAMVRGGWLCGVACMRVFADEDKVQGVGSRGYACA